MGHPSLASEFPHDNAEISVGTVWICPELTGPATALLAPHEPVSAQPFVLFFDDEEPAVEGPLELLVDDVEPSVAPREAEPEPPAFAHFESALSGVLMANGASRAAASLARVLRLEALPADGVSKEALLTLQSRGYLDGSSRYTAKYRELCGAWSDVLRGTSQDFAACGTTTLDRFAAELLAALLAVPATRADELRRQLRKAGVAAFGVLQAA